MLFGLPEKMFSRAKSDLQPEFPNAVRELAMGVRIRPVNQVR
jgi:hypothetical protein